ncbi:MAG: hypothetical protein ACK4UN_20170, partial [Limisphaerales bacterium]
GEIKGNLNGQLLEHGKSYKMTAFVGSGTNSLFTNWTQIVAGTTNLISDNPISFVMQSNLIIEANFILNPFVPASGVYNGLFHQTNEVTHDSAGYVTLKVTPKLTFSGKLFLDGNSVSMSGKFNVDGTATREISRSKFGKPNLQVNLALDFANGTDQITGSIANGTEWTASLLADHCKWTTNNPAVAYTNRYTMIVPGFADSEEGPTGFGYGLLVIDPRGKVKLAGGAADGHVLKQGALLSKNGDYPLYAALYVESRTQQAPNGTMTTLKEPKGSMIGWVRLTNNLAAGTTNLAPQGVVKWIKTGWTNNLYSTGFTNVATLLGSRHLAPEKGVRAVDFSEGLLTMSGGNLTGPFNNDVFINTNNAVMVKSPVLNSVKAGLAAKTGLFKGTFIHPHVGGVVTKYFGVVLQDYNYGRGYFVGNDEGGTVLLDPQ